MSSETLRDNIAGIIWHDRQGYNTPESVADYILATIIASVPELVWTDPSEDAHQHQMSGAYEVTDAGHLYFHWINRGDISTDLIARFPTIEAAKAAAQAHYVAQKTDWMMG